MSPARLIAVALGIVILLAALFAPEEWLSEAVWASYIFGAIVWEMVGVLFEKRWRQEPLTRIYRDRLMRLDKVGVVFRLAWFFLFCWWIAHWIVPGW